MLVASSDDDKVVVVAMRDDHYHTTLKMLNSRNEQTVVTRSRPFPSWLTNRSWQVQRGGEMFPLRSRGVFCCRSHVLLASMIMFDVAALLRASLTGWLVCADVLSI